MAYQLGNFQSVHLPNKPQFQIVDLEFLMDQPHFAGNFRLILLVRDFELFKLN